MWWLAYTTMHVLFEWRNNGCFNVSLYRMHPVTLNNIRTLPNDVDILGYNIPAKVCSKWQGLKESAVGRGNEEKGRDKEQSGDERYFSFRDIQIARQEFLSFINQHFLMLLIAGLWRMLLALNVIRIQMLYLPWSNKVLIEFQNTITLDIAYFCTCIALFAFIVYISTSKLLHDHFVCLFSAT